MPSNMVHCSSINSQSRGHAELGRAYVDPGVFLILKTIDSGKPCHV